MGKCLWLLIGLAWAAVNPARAGEVLVNGNLEDFADGFPVGWHHALPGMLPPLESTAHASPFTLVYSASTRSMYFPAGADIIVGPVQTFTSFTSPYRLSFDFRVDGPAVGPTPWLILPMGQSNAEFYLGIHDGQFRISDGPTFGGTPHAVTPLQAGLWYHVAVEANPAARTYRGSILPFGGAPISWEPLAMNAYDGFTGALALSSFAFVDIPIYFDNFSLVAVPEPSVISLVALGMVGFMWRRLHLPRTVSGREVSLNRVRI